MKLLKRLCRWITAANEYMIVDINECVICGQKGKPSNGVIVHRVTCPRSSLYEYYSQLG